MRHYENSRLTESNPLFWQKYRIDDRKGRLKGKVKDSTGLPLAGARVWIRENDSSTYSDDEGSFSIDNLRPADYSIVIEAEGFQTAVCELRVNAGDNTGADFSLLRPYNWFLFNTVRSPMRFEFAD